MSFPIDNPPLEALQMSRSRPSRVRQNRKMLSVKMGWRDQIALMLSSLEKDCNEQVPTRSSNFLSLLGRFWPVKRSGLMELSLHSIASKQQTDARSLCRFHMRASFLGP